MVWFNDWVIVAGWCNCYWSPFYKLKFCYFFCRIVGSFVHFFQPSGWKGWLNITQIMIYLKIYIIITEICDINRCKLAKIIRLTRFSIPWLGGYYWLHNKCFNPKGKGNMSLEYNDTCLLSGYNEPTRKESITKVGTYQAAIMNKHKKSLFLKIIMNQ